MKLTCGDCENIFTVKSSDIRRTRHLFCDHCTDTFIKYQEDKHRFTEDTGFDTNNDSEVE